MAVAISVGTYAPQFKFEQSRELINKNRAYLNDVSIAPCGHTVATSMLLSLMNTDDEDESLSTQNTLGSQLKPVSCSSVNCSAPIWDKKDIVIGLAAEILRKKVIA